jgi:hypothetical protein
VDRIMFQFRNVTTSRLLLRRLKGDEVAERKKERKARRARNSLILTFPTNNLA